MGAAKERGTTTFHPAGTCRMGPRTDPLAVVDDQLRVHGLEALRVIDASIMPTMLSANLNAATLMLADKASDLAAGRRRSPSCWRVERVCAARERARSHGPDRVDNCVRVSRRFTMALIPHF